MPVVRPALRRWRHVRGGQTFALGRPAGLEGTGLADSFGAIGAMPRPTVFIVLQTFPSVHGRRLPIQRVYGTALYFGLHPEDPLEDSDTLQAT